MAWHKSALLALGVLAGCSSSATQPAGGTIAQALEACTRGAQHAEVQLQGTVVRVLGVRNGRSGAPEGFVLAAQSPLSRTLPGIRVEDNIDITGYIPMQRGDQLELQGQYECNDGVVHWTHRDPAGRHTSGHITVNGRTYQ